MSDVLLVEYFRSGVDIPTTLSVPMRTVCGTWLFATISWMKFEVMPMMATSEIASIARTTVKVMPRAPNLVADILQ